MVLKLNEFRDKLAGCWAGKNVGGVLGAPFECKRMVPDVDFYIQDLSMGPPANDDLDLQIVWLAAVERYGRNVNASILGEYWLSYVIPNWVAPRKAPKTAADADAALPALDRIVLLLRQSRRGNECLGRADRIVGFGAV